LSAGRRWPTTVPTPEARLPSQDTGGPRKVTTSSVAPRHADAPDASNEGEADASSDEPAAPPPETTNSADRNEGADGPACDPYRCTPPRARYRQAPPGRSGQQGSASRTPIPPRTRSAPCAPRLRDR